MITEKKFMRKTVKGEVIFEQAINEALLEDLAKLFRNSGYDTYRHVTKEGLVRVYSNEDCMYEIIL